MLDGAGVKAPAGGVPSPAPWTAGAPAAGGGGGGAAEVSAGGGAASPQPRRERGVSPRMKKDTRHHEKPKEIVAKEHAARHGTADENVTAPRSTFNTPFPMKRSNARMYVRMRRRGEMLASKPRMERRRTTTARRPASKLATRPGAKPMSSAAAAVYT